MKISRGKKYIPYLLLGIFIYVDIKGAVYNPGVYKVSNSTRLFQLITKAGGLLKNADEISVNFSILLLDEQVIYIPRIGELVPTDVNQEDEDTEGLININDATLIELETLPGIGPSTAQSIIDYRIEFGDFETGSDNDWEPHFEMVRQKLNKELRDGK